MMITNLIELRMGKLILNHLLGNTCPEFCSGVLDSWKIKSTLGSDCLELCFWRVALKSILTQQYYKNTSRFKHSMVHMPSLNLTSISFLLYLGFVCSPSTVTAQKANVYSPWNSCLAFITPRLIIILNAFFSSDIGSATEAHWKRDKTLCFKW